MEEIINRIIAADLSAQEKLHAAEEAVRQALKQMNLDKGRVEEEVWNNAKQFVETEKQRLEKQLILAREEQNDQYKTSLVALEENFARQRESWRKEMYTRCQSLE